MTTTKGKLQDLKQKVYALLIPHKHGCTLRQLAQDYYDIQGESIPYQDFGYGSLITLLRDMHHTVRIDFNNGKHIVRGIPSSNSGHISALVAGQKTDSKKTKHLRKQFRPSPYYPTVPVPPVQIQVCVLSKVIDLAFTHPNGISKMEVLQMIQSNMPHTPIYMQDMEAQLQQLSHAISVSGNYIYPKKQPTPLMDCPTFTQSKSIPNDKKIVVGGCEELEEICDYDDDNDFNFIPAGCTQSSVKKVNTTKRRPISSFIQDSLSNCPDKKADENLRTMCEKAREEHRSLVHPEEQFVDEKNKEDDEAGYINQENVDILINDRLKIRLEKLVQKYPDGIWCAQLPDKYLEEYKVPLNYVELGFNSVREFASLLPNIFQCVLPTDTGDYMLYSTSTKLQPSPKDKQKASTLVDLHSMTNIWEGENDVLPSAASLSICKEIIPDNVLTIGECVGVTNVEDLANMDKPFLEVVVVEVFTPTFFWIHLRKRTKAFKSFMSDLHHFYESGCNNLIIPSVVLEKGLNCACAYNGVWHRGIIKAVNPDLQVTVFFYDYGTLKTYPSSDLRYLHRQFSHLPAQAIACGLANTKPYNGTRWTKSVTHKFASKTCQIPLIATIASINEEDNTMMIALTDTSEEEDVHINDWMVERKLALYGKMDEDVELKNMLIYVEENLLFAPERCYEDESVISREKEHEDETTNEPLILPKSTLLDTPIRPPPGFSIPGKPLTLECIWEEQCQSASSPTTETQNPSTVQNGTTNNTYSQETPQPEVVPKLTPEKFIEMHNINLKLQERIRDALNALLCKCVNDPSNSYENYEAIIQTFLRNTQLESIIKSMPNVDPNSTNSMPTHLYNDTLSHPTPNSTTTNFGTSTTNVPKANTPFSMPKEPNHQQANINVSLNPFTNGCDLPANHFNGASTGHNIFEQKPTPASSINMNGPESIGALNEKFTNLNVVDNPISTYFNPPVNTYSNYFNVERMKPPHFPEAPKVDTNTHNQTYQNNLVNHDTRSRETNPFKRILATKRRLSESSDDNKTTISTDHYDVTKHNQPVHNLGILQPNINGTNLSTGQFQVPSCEPKLDTNCNVYSSIPKTSGYFPNGTRNGWGPWDQKNDVSNGFDLCNPMCYNGLIDTSVTPKEAPDTRTYMNGFPNNYLGNPLFQAPVQRLPDDSSHIFHGNTGRQHVNVNLGRPGAPYSYFNQIPRQQPMTNGFDIKVPDSFGGFSPNTLPNGNYCLDPNVPSWSPINGFTSPLLTDNTDEGYQTRPSTSNTLQDLSPLLQTVPNEDSKRQNESDNNSVDKSENKNPLTHENRTITDYLIDYGLSRNTSDLNNKHALQKVKIYNCGTNLLCRQVELPGCFVHIFHYRGEGWILTADFVDAFIEYTTPTYMISLFQILALDIEYLQIEKFNFSKIPELNDKIQRLTRDASGTLYKRVHLILLKTAVKVLINLNVVTKDDLHKSILKEEFIKGSISHQLWVVITAYGEFLRVIESGEYKE